MAAWTGVGVFWFVVTRGIHPRLSLAVIVSTSLITTFAAGAYINHLVLIPRYLDSGRTGRYVVTLFRMVVALTAVTLSINRTSYLLTLGPDPDPYGLYKHYGIDFVLIATHLLAVVAVVWMFKRFARS